MSKLYGIVARFETPAAIYHAAETVRDAGYRNWDCITPFPVHGLDAAMGLKRSKVPVFTFIGGAIGFVTGATIAWFMGAFDYPLIVGGKPFFDPVFPFPVIYELTILLASFGTLGGMFILNQLPMHYHPIMNYERYESLTDDQFALVVEARDPQFNETVTRQLLQELEAVEVVPVYDDEDGED